MHIIDILIFTVYMLLVLGIGIYFLRKNKNADDYYVGGRSMSSPVIGLSVVATDVGGGFSIGLGGLGFLMLHSYAFMVSGLFIPVLGAFFTRKGSATAAFWAMITGGGTTLTLTLLSVKLPFGLDPNIFGITAAALFYILLSILFPGRRNVID